LTGHVLVAGSVDGSVILLLSATAAPIQPINDFVGHCITDIQVFQLKYVVYSFILK